jgi:signal transduction histidine kinase
VEAFGAALNETSEGLSGKQRDYINRMRNAAGRMRSMVDALLALSRVERSAQPFITVDLEQIARDVLSMLELQIRQSGGRVEIGRLPRIQADPVQMQQLLQNLVGNALKFHPKDAPAEVRVHARTLDGWVELSVQDNGIGFEQSEAGRIFQPFQRLVGRSEYEGSGMGLAICRKIVERHHGTIRVQSTPGQGSTFLVRLQAHQPVEPNTS